MEACMKLCAKILQPGERVECMEGCSIEGLEKGSFYSISSNREKFSLVSLNEISGRWSPTRFRKV